MDELTRLKLRNAELEAALASSERSLASAREILAQQQAEMEALHLFDRELTRSEELETVLNYVLNWARMHARADYGIIAQWDDRRHALEVLLANGFPLEQDYQTGDILNLPAAIMPPEAQDKLSSDVLFDPTQNRLVCELRHASGQLIGVLMLQRHNKFAFTDIEKKFMRSVADRLAVAIHMSSLLKRVQDLNSHRHQLFRMLSHDLRQPLTVLMGYIQLLEHAVKSDKLEVVGNYLGFISTGAKDLSELLEEVLLMERVSGASRSEWETISLRRLTELALEKLNSQVALHDHEVAIDLPEDEAMCQGLSVELREAIANLISNAVKYTPSGGHIHISLTSQDSHWVFQVQDNGYGIDEKRQERLFESFYRAQQPGTENIKGSGLGLSLVKAIIEKHDGEIFFRSKVGEGSTFGFWIPASA